MEKHETISKQMTVFMIAVITLTAVLTVIGFFLIYSGSAVFAATDERCGYDSLYFVERQIFFTVVGLFGVFVVGVIGLVKIKKNALYIGVCSWIMLLILCFTPLGRNLYITGMIEIIGIRLQVIPFIIMTYAVLLGHLVEKYWVDDERLLISTWSIAIVLFYFLRERENASVAAFFVLIYTFVVTWCMTDCKKMHRNILIAVVLLILAGIAYAFCVYEPGNFSYYRVERIMAWLHPQATGIQKELQIAPWSAVRTAGFLGHGWMNSSLARNDLYDDSTMRETIFAVVCEDFGWLGGAIVLILIGILLYFIFKLIRLCLKHQMYYDATVTIGVFVYVMFFTIYGSGQVLNLLPVDNVAIPLLSYDDFGTSIILIWLSYTVYLANEFRRCYKKKSEHERYLGDECDAS